MNGIQDAPARRSRRKACDLCFKKKIKCDRTKPRCSHCKIYKEAECTFTPLTRVSNPKPSSTRVDTLEARLKELEARLKEVEAVAPPGLPSEEYSVLAPNEVFVPGNPTPSADVSQADLANAADSSGLTPESLTSILDSDGSGPNQKQGGGYQLPALHEVLPWVSEYFATSNRVMPLFHEGTFIRTLRDWYTTPVSQQDPAVWGLINVVLALSRRHLYLDISSPRGTLDVYVRNAQSVLNHLITRDEDLLGIQVVLGLAMIFYGTSDPKPATVLLATACRLAYALRLNTREFRDRGNELCQADDDLILQRQRVFWVLYINDRDISMRINQPALLHEADIDIELPEEDPADGTGVLYASNDVHFNFFRKRAQFAWIQGKVYEWLFSVRAEKLSPTKKEENTRRLERALSQWDASLPEEFRPDMLCQITDLITFQNMMGLHFIHLQTLAIIHQSYSYNAHWLETLRRQSGKMMDESTNEDLKALLPKGWSNMVERSRSCLGLFSLLPEHSLYLVWMSCCAFFSSLIFLIVNNMVDPHHPLLDQDQHLIAFALKVITKLVDETGNDKARSMLGACVELDSKTQIVVERARSHRLSDDALADLDFTDDADFFEPVPPLPGFAEGDDVARFFGGFETMDTGFGSEVQAQLLDYDVQIPVGKENPNFDGVVSEMLKQRWF